ncbi:hypothetical protein BC351_39105 [Paenibacillus ferrarius]|uniref:ABC transporter ATP-binding protein n=1 Tax=Paenibacillus ferrarius TaxID=1469647 RepID=A0A1V4HAA0_9BACL|nr:ABC transporter ATP-binding protein [Paenibacillus ferrarius]OPH47999.1 hypothetical protein BC351_39105 [Paenibacillus ferrarius]
MLGNSYSSYRVYKWCLSYLRPYKKIVALFLVLITLQSCVQIAIPKVIQLFIDRLLPQKNETLFHSYMLVMVGMVIITIIASAFQHVVGTRFQEKASMDLQMAVFRKLRDLGFSYYERNSIGETFSYFQTEIPAVQQIHRKYFPSIVRLSIPILMSLAFLMTISIPLSLVFMPSIVLYMLGGPFLERLAANSGSKSTWMERELGKKQYDTLSSMLELRLFGREKWGMGRLIVAAQAAGDALYRHFIHINLRGAIRRVAVYSGGLLLFIVGYVLVRNEELSIGAFVSFALLFFRIIFDLTILVTNLTEQRVLLIRAKGLYQFMQIVPDVTETPHATILPNVRGDIQFHQLNFHYAPAVPILQELDLHIRPGEKVAIVGASGGGKSTVGKLIGRFYDPTAGEIFLDSVPIRSLQLKQLRESIGFVFQETYLFGMSIKENIRFGNPEATDSEIEAAARAAYAHEFILKLPDGYETNIGERGTMLSGGEKQRIAIARMIVKNPAILILDEATASLDSISESKVTKAIETLSRGKTTILIAHRLSAIRNCDRVIYMEGGRVTEMGTYSEMMQKGGKFYELVNGTGENRMVPYLS